MWSEDPNPNIEPTFDESDTYDDRAQQHVLHCLMELGQRQQEVMFVLSQLEYGNYLNKPSYAAAAGHLPRPADLSRSYHRGDFDVMVLHRNYGLLVGEIKSVGLKFASLSKSQAEADADVAKRVQTALKQLDKSETVIGHIVSDIAHGLLVKKTIMLPYVTAEQLERALKNNPQLAQVRTHCLWTAFASYDVGPRISLARDIRCVRTECLVAQTHGLYHRSGNDR
nr:hypothetical protein BaRGS_017807 [Batillaria attramentaria]